MEKQKKWPKVGSLRQSEDKVDNDGEKIPGNFYIKIDADMTLRKGDTISAQKPSDKYARLLDKGIINKEEHDAQVAKIPDYIKLDLFLVPKN